MLTLKKAQPSPREKTDEGKIGEISVSGETAQTPGIHHNPGIRG
jgi:hypothetical protein